MEPTSAGSAGSVAWVRFGDSTFMFDHKPHGIIVRLRNTKQEDGHIYGDLHAYQDLDDGEGERRLLVRPKVNLTSDRSLPGLAKSLITRLESYNWNQLLEIMCSVLVDQMDRKGVVTELREVHGAEIAQPMLFKHFVPAGLLTGLTAHGGTGKSLVAAMMSIAIATGQPVGPFVPLQQGPVLYLDWENDHTMHERRITRLCMGLGVPFPGPGMITHYQAFASLTRAEGDVIELAYRVGAVATFLDSIGYAAGANLNDSDVATGATTLLKRLPGTKVMIAHVSKASLESATKGLGPTGSAFFWNGPQAVYKLNASDQELDESMILSIYHDKRNVGEKLRRPLGIRMSFMDPDGPITPETVEITGDSIGGEALPLPVRVLDYLAHRHDKVTAEDIAEGLQLSPESVGRTLRELRDKKRVFSWGQPAYDGKKRPLVWGIAAREYGAPASSWTRAAVKESDEPDLGMCTADGCTKPAVMYSQSGQEVCRDHFP